MLTPRSAYYVAFGPHGPRAPSSKPGDGIKVFAGTAALVGVAGIIFLSIRAISKSLLFTLNFTKALCLGPPPPKTISKEWEEAANQRALEQKMNPITGRHFRFSYQLNFLFGHHRYRVGRIHWQGIRYAQVELRRVRNRNRNFAASIPSFSPIASSKRAFSLFIASLCIGK